jgi:beta-glucosidase-like glycosyl hydrolase
MGKAVVRGLQGDNPKYLKLHGCAKHYAVHRFYINKKIIFVCFL